jgi:hypothetical protein
MKRAKLPDDVGPDQVWQDPDGQHFKVNAVVNGVAKLSRCTPAGRVLNQRYTASASVERMQADWKLVSG